MPKSSKMKKKGAITKKAKPSGGGSMISKIQEHSPEAEELLLRFLGRVLLWLRTNHARVVNLFSKFDSDKDNELSIDDFFVGMRMMDAPATRAEIDQMISIIDLDSNGKINILEFDQMLRDYHRKLLSREQGGGEASDQDLDDVKSATSLVLSPSRVSTKCKYCLIGKAEPPKERNPRFVKLQVTLAPFKDYKAHPGHFEVELTDSTTIHGLKMHIQSHLGEAVDTVALFKEASCTKESYLAPSWCLEHCGMVGGSRLAPTSGCVFYDYMPALDDCPLLMDDSHIPKLEQGQLRKTSYLQNKQKLSVQSY